MAMSYAFRVIENGARDLVLQVTAADASTTTAATADGTSAGILVAGVSGFTPGTSLKVRRILYNLQNNIVKIQWHQTTNTDIAILSGWGDLNLDAVRSGTQGVINDKGTGSTGDIDLANFAVNTVTGGAGLVTASMTLVLFMTKGT